MNKTIQEYFKDKEKAVQGMFSLDKQSNYYHKGRVYAKKGF